MGLAFDVSSLNPEQREAVEHESGPLMVFAGAGSGKTRVITMRISRLVAEGVAPHRILAVTFTNKAAREMRERIEEMVGPVAKEIWMGTFHSLCARTLRIDGHAIGIDRNFVVYDDADQMGLVRDLIKRSRYDDKTVQPRAVLAEISRAKEKLLTPDAYAETAAGFFERVVAEIYPDYAKGLQKANAMDFDDLLMKTVRLLENAPEVREKYQSRFLHVLVDEYQDVNFAQYKFADLMSGQHRNLTIVGDDDQSIYAWRGADVSLMLRFTSDHPDAKVVKLERNYRSTQAILDAAHSVVKHNRSRADKRLKAEIQGGDKITVTEAGTEQDEAMLVADHIQSEVRKGRRKYGDFAALYRTNAQSRSLEEAFLSMRMPHVLVGGQRFYERKEIKDMLAYLRLAWNGADDVSLRRVVNVPARGIGDKSVQAIDRRAQALGAPMLGAMRDQELQASLPKRVGGQVRRFAAVIEQAGHEAEQGKVSPVLRFLLTETGYLDDLKARNTEEDLDRLDNLQELVTVTEQYDRDAEAPSLGEFLEHAALMADVDGLNSTGDAITLMTVHSSKGLEFREVFLLGMEEGVFPHSRSRDSDEDIEEERRLAYVGMTRAKERLHLTYARRRSVWGQPSFNARSRFVDDIPAPMLDTLGDRVPVAGPNRQVLQDRSGTYAVVEKAEAPSKPDWTPPFNVGDKVRHRKFGLGIVVACSPLKSSDAEVTVAFPGDVGIKKLVQSLAKLEGA